MDEKETPSISEYLYGVVFTPTKTFSLFRYYKPWGWALIFLLVINIASILLNVLGGEWSQILASLPPYVSTYILPMRASIGIFLGVFLYPVIILFFVFHVSFVHFLAELLGGSGQVIGLFSALAFTQILSLVSAVLKFFVSLVGGGGLAFFAPIAIVLGVWQIILAIIAIREIYLLSNIKSVLIFFLPVILVFAILIFMLVTGVIFFGPMLGGFGALNL